MSAIDCVEHVHIANFYDIAHVYWLNGIIARSAIATEKFYTERLVDSNFLCIGGGSGEHPALFINIDHALASLFEDQLPYFDNPHAYIDYNEWDLEKFKFFNDKMNKDIDRGFNDTKFNNLEFENKLLHSVGFLILTELPLKQCVKNEKLLKLALLTKEGKNEWDSERNYRYEFIGFTGVLPSATWGCRTVDGKLQFKNSLHDWYRNNT